jgi:H+/Cl- antiporter ClcA
MAVGSASMWIANPIAWLWIGSQLQRESRQMTLGAYLLLLVGIVLTAVGLAIALERLNRLYGRVTGAPPELRLVFPWHRSMRDARHGGRDEPGRPTTVLDVVMTISVAICVLAFLVWYFATNPTPPGIEPGASKD